MNTEMYKETQITCFDIFQSRFITCLFFPTEHVIFTRSSSFCLEEFTFFSKCFFCVHAFLFCSSRPFFVMRYQEQLQWKGRWELYKKKKRKIMAQIFMSNPSSNNTKQPTKDQITQNFSFSLHSCWETNLFHHF